MGCFWWSFVGGGGEEVGEGELGGADGVGEIYVEGGVAVGDWWVAGLGAAGGMPEVRRGLMDGLLEWDEKGEMGHGRKHRFEDTGAGADYLCTAEFFASNVEHAL